MKIAFFETKPEEKAFFLRHLGEEDVSFFSGTLDEELRNTSDFDVVSIFVHSHVTDAILQKLPNLKYLQTRSTGYDHIKCRALYERGLAVSNVAGYGGPAVAEFAFSLLLNATRKTYLALWRSKERDFEYADLKGIELYGKTLGILGLGTIGSQMARIAKGFGMDIVAYSRTKRDIVDELGIVFCGLQTVLERSDILMIALPLTPATKHLLNLKNIRYMKKDAIVVNTARGEIIDDAVYGEKSHIFCLDVIEDTRRISQENVLYTPHMAYYTHEALERIMQISLANIRAFLKHEPLPNCLKLACRQDYHDISKEK